MPQGSPEDLVAAARAAGVTDARVLSALLATPRVEFVPGEYADGAYLDRPVRITHGQTTTQPSLSAAMIASLGLTGGERVLEIGTGYGFQTALLAQVAADVTSVERWPDMVETAAGNLARQGIRNVDVVVGDGTEGHPERAPYDGILVSAAFPEVPSPLVGQLRIGGRLVQPVGPGGEERVKLFERTTEGLVLQDLVIVASFVRLYGSHGFSDPEPPGTG